MHLLNIMIQVSPLRNIISFLNFVSYKYDMKLDDLMNDFSLFIKDEHEKILNTTIEDDYKNFVEARGDDLQNEFSELHDFQTNTRGLKVRGSFSSEKEAEMRAKSLRELDGNHDIYVGEVGKWMPFNPEAYKTGKVQYLEEELNSIMNYKANQDDIEKVNFDERVLNSKKEAVSNNIKKAKETGNKLTQRLDDAGILNDNKSSIVSNDIVNDVLTSNVVTNK